MRWSTRKVLYYLDTQADGAWVSTDAIQTHTFGIFRGRSLEDLAALGLITTRWAPVSPRLDDVTSTSARSLRLSRVPTAEWQITSNGRMTALHLHTWKSFMINSRRMRDRMANRESRPV